MKTIYPSIKKALEVGIIESYFYRWNDFHKVRVNILIKYRKPQKTKSGHWLASEWYECSPVYWERVLYPKYYK